jgi:hypothetical protein
VVQSAGTMPNEAEITSSNPHPSSCADMSKKKKIVKMPKAFSYPCSGLHSISIINQRTRKVVNIYLRNGPLSQESTIVSNVDMKAKHERKKERDLMDQ